MAARERLIRFYLKFCFLCIQRKCSTNLCIFKSLAQSVDLESVRLWQSEEAWYFGNEFVNGINFINTCVSAEQFYLIFSRLSQFSNVYSSGGNSISWKNSILYIYIYTVCTLSKLYRVYDLARTAFLRHFSMLVNQILWRTNHN